MPDLGPRLLMLLLCVASSPVNVNAAAARQHHQATASLKYNPLFLSRVEECLDELLVRHRAFWAEGGWYNISTSDHTALFSLYYSRVGSSGQQKYSMASAKTSPVTVQDPTGIYSPVDALNQHLITRRDLPFIYQNEDVVPCQNAASTSIISGGKALDFAAFAAGVLTLVININNNVNNNNNNNNNINLNAIDSSNIVASFNTNNANQVNVMPTGRKKRSVVGQVAVLVLNAIKAALRSDKDDKQMTEGSARDILSKIPSPTWTSKGYKARLASFHAF